MGKALVLSGPVPSPCNLRPRNCNALSAPALDHSPQPRAESSGRHLSAAFIQSDPLTLLPRTWTLPSAVTFLPVLRCARPQTAGPQEGFLFFNEGNRRDSILLHKSLFSGSVYNKGA